MFTAAISALLGLVSGTVPNLVKEWTASREHDREKDMLITQTELQLKIAKQGGQTRVAEMDREVEISAYGAQSAIATQSMKTSGVKWTDAWNAALRPFAVTLIILMFVTIASFYAYGILSNVETPADATAAAKLLWASLIGESIQAVLGFLFGYRSTKK